MSLSTGNNMLILVLDSWRCDRHYPVQSTLLCTQIIDEVSSSHSLVIVLIYSDIIYWQNSWDKNTHPLSGETLHTIHAENELSLSKDYQDLFLNVPSVIYRATVYLNMTDAGSSSMPGFSKSSRVASGFSFQSSSSRLICTAEIWRPRSCSSSEGIFTSQRRNVLSCINGCHWVGSLNEGNTSETLTKCDPQIVTKYKK